jgi:ATP-dependent helicase YprA (DUF1998 family)/very-short-patch-repair endonuclease
MNPLRIARNLRDDYLTLLRTTFSPRQRLLREEFNHQIERDGFLTREPFISLAMPYQYAPALDWLLPEARSRFGSIAERPFAHQAEAARRIADGLPTVIATGTGSGKTEAFLMPIVDHCLRHRGQSGLRAIIVYPMNALANDQLRRVRTLLADSGVSFGRYTGETQLSGKRPPDVPGEERVTRTEFRQSPPDILLTNYQMLEYMLLRGDGREIFRGHRIQFIVLDEVHTYHGSLGTDVACLLRRLRATLAESRPGAPAQLFIGTSATLLSENGSGDVREGIAAFFSRLTAQETGVEAVVTEQVEAPELPGGISLPPPPDISEEELDAFDPSDSRKVLNLTQRLADAPEDTSPSPENLWQATALPYLLLRWLSHPLSLNDILQILSQQPGREDVAQDRLRREVEAALLVGPCLPESHPLRLRPRVHRFLRGLARFWRCTHPDCGRLLDEGIESCNRCGSQTLPLAICRTCGWDFFTGRIADGQRVEPWLERISTPKTLYLYDPPAVHVNVDSEESPFEGDEDEPEATAANQDEMSEEGSQDPEAYLCPQCLVFSETATERACACPDLVPRRAIRVHRGRGTRCPICRSRYGRFDVLTPLSLGNSSALTHIARTLLRELPEGQQKLLVFCDSRQDAAHQARFIDGVEDHLRLRRAVYSLLWANPLSHDLRWLVEHVYHRFVDQGFLPRTRSRDAMQRAMDQIEGGLLAEFVLAANVRASLERLGLVTVSYGGLEDEMEKEPFRQLCTAHGLELEQAQLAVRRLLDLMRSRFAVNHEAFRTRLYQGDRLSQRFGFTPGRQVGVPVAFLPPGSRSQNSTTYKLLSTWNTSGTPAGAQQIWRQVLGEHVSADSLAAVLDWLHHQGWLVWTTIGRQASEVEGYQLELGAIEFLYGAQAVRCDICGRVVAGDQPGLPCPRSGCPGHLITWEGTITTGNLNALLIAAEHAPPLRPAEHSAAISDERRQQIEDGFQSDPPVYNVLVCTPTLELGVNIGDLEAVAMRNVPPNPAHYAQRAGRTGRRSRMGMIAGFARNTPHDGYFFDHPDEVISGAIPPPHFNLANLEAIARHLHSLALEEARIEFPSNLTTFIGEEGSLNTHNLQMLVDQILAAVGRAHIRAGDVFGPLVAGLREDWVTWLEVMIQEVPQLVQSAIEKRAGLIESAVSRMREIAQRVRQTPREQDAEQGYRNLARKLREDYRYAYLPRVLAEEGILPGYAFPGDPGSLALAYDPDPIFAGRLQAQREFAPGQIIYARGYRWRVAGIAINRPGAISLTRGAERFEYTECPSCGLAGPASGVNNCARCHAELSGPTRTAWDAGAFQAWPADVEPETEEERQSLNFDVRAHPQRDVPSQNFALGPWMFELRSQEQIWWINHGPLPSPSQRQEPGSDLAAGFHMCPVCGELRPEPQPARQNERGRRPRNRDPRANRDPHDERCGGTAVHIAIGHQTRADTLRLIVPGLSGLEDEGVEWAWSLAWAVVHGAIRLFDLDEDDLEPRVLTRKEGHTEEVLEIIWVDTVLGGSGILREIVTKFSQVAAAALAHLRDHDCPSSCYRCLRTYRNQRVHMLLNWRLVTPQLTCAQGDPVTEAGGTSSYRDATDGPEWDTARREGCGSPLELKLLLAMRQHGLPEPEKQFRIDDAGRMITRADFAYPTERLLIYVDGLAFHSSLRQRIHDASQTNQLQVMGYRVLRLIGNQITRAPGDCVDQIRMALAVGRSNL